jgi:hypothetical protein
MSREDTQRVNMFERWAGRVDEKLDNMEGTLSQIKEATSTIIERQITLEKTQENLEKHCIDRHHALDEVMGSCSKRIHDVELSSLDSRLDRTRLSASWKTMGILAAVVVAIVSMVVQLVTVVKNTPPGIQQTTSSQK